MTLSQLTSIFSILGLFSTPALAAPAPSIAETGEYKVEISGPANAGAKSETNLTVTITPKKGWKLNQDFPAKIKLSVGPGATVRKAEQKKGDAKKMTEKTGGQWVFAVDLVQSGKMTFQADAKFAVCTDNTCDPKRASVSHTIAVK